MSVSISSTRDMECESESRSVVSHCLRPHGLYRPWNSPGQNTEVGSCSLLQGIFPTQGSNPGLLHWRWILYQLSHKGSPRTWTCSTVLENMSKRMSAQPDETVCDRSSFLVVLVHDDGVDAQVTPGREGSRNSSVCASTWGTQPDAGAMLWGSCCYRQQQPWPPRYQRCSPDSQEV